MAARNGETANEVPPEVSSNWVPDGGMNFVCIMTLGSFSSAHYLVAYFVVLSGLLLGRYFAPPVSTAQS